MTTYYVRSSGGSDANAGTSFGAAFATINHALYSNATGNSSLAAGDTVVICADGDHILTAEVMMNTTSGSRDSRIIVSGGNGTTGAIDGTVATIRPTTSTIAKLFSNGTSGTVTDYYFQYLSVSGKDSGGTKRGTILFDLSGTNTSVRWIWRDCVLADASSDNIKLRGIGFQFINCNSSGAGGAGFGKNGTPDSANFFNCSSANNAGVGFACALASERYEYCLAYENGSHGFHSSSGGVQYQGSLVNCVSFANTGAGLCINQVDTTTGSLSAITNCSFCNNSYGIQFTNAGVTTLGDVRQTVATIAYNHSYNNSSGDTNISGPAWSDFGPGQIGGDPLFTDAANGDFTPESGSPLLNAGLGNSNIGQVQNMPSGGGSALHLGSLGQTGIGVF